MRWTRCRSRVVLLLLLPLILVGCFDDDSGIDDPEERRLLILLNAQHNDGRTVRWDPLPVRVFLNNVAGEDEVTEWTRVSDGKVTFTFVGSPPASGISFRLANLDDDVCGVTNIEFEDDRFTSAEVDLHRDNYRAKGCVRTVTHEAGHAIGILDHTSDGGLMDPDGGDGDITRPVEKMVKNLYSLDPGTEVGLLPQRRSAARRHGSRYVITIVDYVKR